MRKAQIIHRQNKGNEAQTRGSTSDKLPQEEHVAFSPREGSTLGDITIKML